MKAAVLESIKKSAAVPSMPQVVLRFLELIQDPDFQYQELARVLSADAGTAGEILRLANSALFGVQQRVVSLQQALTLLGPKRIRSMLLGRYLVDSLSQKSVSGLDMSYFWRRSLTSSLVAAQFAGRLSPTHHDEASIAALLADIGIPILLEAFPDAYGPIAAEYKPGGRYISVTREQKAVEVTHSEVSAMVLAYWSLPESVANGVNMHQSKDPGTGEDADIARILNSSDRIAKILCEVPPVEDITSVCAEATAFVGAEPGILSTMLPAIETDIEELAAALHVDVIKSDGYALIAKTVEEQPGVPVSG